MDKQMKAVFLMFAALLVSFAAWVTHIVVCIKAANYVFLIAGALVPFVGIIHGWGVWIGAW